MTTINRYIIVLDRMDDDDHCFGPSGAQPPRDDQEGMEQVAAELQEAMDQTGEPAGFFRVVARAEVEYDKATHIATSQDDAHRAAMRVLDDTRTY